MTRRGSHQNQPSQGTPRDSKSAHTAGDTTNRWKDPNTYIALGTLGLVLIGLGALWVSRDSEERQLRAYILVTDFGVVCQPCRDTTLTLPNFPGGLNSALMMRIQNSGETPASHIKPTFNWWPVHRPSTQLPADFKFPDLGAIDSQHLNSSSELGKDEHGDAIGPLTQAGIATLEDAPSDADTVFLYGHVDYCDVFGHPHSTAYCFEYERGLGDALPKCDRFNGEIAPRGACTGAQRR